MKTRIRCLLAALIATNVAPMRGPALSPSVALAPRRRKVKPYVLGCAAAGALSTCVSHTLTLPLDVLTTRNLAVISYPGKAPYKKTTNLTTQKPI